MSKINEIQSAILALEGGAYQKLLDQYLHRKYHFTNIHSLGIQNATNKTTKGIPDTYVIEDDKYILICHGTVNEQPANKIKRDITDCLTKAKTSLDVSKIAKIICCYTSSNITPKQCEELKKTGGDIEVELINLTTLSHDLVNNYRSLAFDHLQIELDTHQMYSVDDFIISYDKSGTNAPINTKFCSRKVEFDRITKSLKDNSITVLSGPAGIGKTRLALEASKSFEKDGWITYCIRSNGELLYNDLEDYLDLDEKYLLFFDDANTIAQLGNVLDACFNLSKPSQIKVILTVREYAKKRVLLETRKYSDSEEISLAKLNDDAIKSILEKNYNIKNHEFLDKICKISNGNARLAVLAGIRAIESGLQAINNAEDIYRNYYDPIIDRIEINKNDLILLAIISFFGAVRINEDDLYKRLIEEYLADEYSIDIIEKLNNLELIDWFEKDIVRISDQSLGNYIQFYVIHEKEWIDLCYLIDLCIPRWTKLIVNLIDMLLNQFRSEELSVRIKRCVNESWDKADESLQKKYIEAFFPINPLKGLLYLKNFVQNTETQEYDLNALDFDSKKNTNCIVTREIEMLANYKYSDHYDDALSLFFSLYDKQPVLFMDFYFAITNYLLFDKYTYRHGYAYERKIMELLWERCKEGDNFNYSILYLRVAEYALGTEFTYTDSNGNKSLVLYRMKVPINDRLKDLRSSIWYSIKILYDNPNYHKLAQNILLKSHINGLYESDYKDLCCSDFDELYPFLSEKIPLSFEKAMILGQYRDVFEQLDITLDERFNLLSTSNEYRIYSSLSRTFSSDCSFEESKKKRQQIIVNLIADYSLDDYNSMFMTCALIEEQNSDERWSISEGLNIVFLALETDMRKLKEVVKLYLSNGAPFDVRPLRIMQCLLTNCGYDDTKRLLIESSEKLFSKWYSELLCCVPDSVVNENIANDYFLFQKNEFSKLTGIIIPLQNAIKYLKFNNAFLDEINIFLLAHTDYISCFFGNAYGDDMVRIICESYCDRFDALVDLYFACDHMLFDYEDRLFLSIYKKSPDLTWKRYISELRDEDRISKHECTAFAHIWEADDYSERIDYAFSELIEKNAFASERVFSVVFANHDKDSMVERKKEWILNKLHANISNTVIVNKILNIVNSIYPSWITDVILDYLKHNQDVENFKKLHLFAMSYSWSGSEIPLLNRKISFLENIRDSLSGNEYIEHKLYLNDVIRCIEKRREDVKKREYLEEYMI